MNIKHADRAFDALVLVECMSVKPSNVFCRQKCPKLYCHKVKSKLRIVLNMVAQMDAEGFGNCTNTGAK
jgi:hypothetical protein